MNDESEKTEFVLAGLDGSNPLMFMAALGALRALDLSSGGAKLAWDDQLRPVLTNTQAVRDRDELCSRIADIIRSMASDILARSRYDSEVIAIDADAFRTFAKSQPESPALSRLPQSFAAAFGSDVVLKDDGRIEPTRFSFANGNSRMVLLDQFRAIVLASSAPGKSARKGEKQAFPELGALIHESLFDGKRRAGRGLSFRWDPLEFRTAAHMAEDPTNTTDAPLWTLPGANLLAVLGLTFFTSVPLVSKLATTAMLPGSRGECFAWPLWSCLLTPDVVFSLLSAAEGTIDEPPAAWRTERGIFARFAAQRLSKDKGLFFTQSFAF